MSDRAMIEGAMFLHRDSLNQVIGVAQTGALGEAFVSDALVRLFEFDAASAASLLGRYYGIEAHLIDREAISAFLVQAVLPSSRDAGRGQGLIRYRRNGSFESEM